MAKKPLPAFMTKGKSVGKEVVAKAKKGKGKPAMGKAMKGKNPFAKY